MPARGVGQGPLPVLAGVTVALSLPLHLRGERLRRLTREPESGGSDSTAPLDITMAHRTGQRALRLLARVRLPGWRNTCLYRATLHCILLRRAGRPAVVRIGARRGGAAIEAHAWVEVRGEVVPPEAEGYAPLRGHLPTAG